MNGDYDYAEALDKQHREWEAEQARSHNEDAKTFANMEAEEHPVSIRDRVRDRVREEIAQVLHRTSWSKWSGLPPEGAVWEYCSEWRKEEFRKMADVKILAIDSLAVVDRKAELPENPHWEYLFYKERKEAQEEMVNLGYVKEVKE